MNTINVALPHNSYEIKVGAGILAQAGPWLKGIGFNGKAVIITDSNVRPLYADALSQSLAGAGFSVTLLEVPAGEAAKTLETAASLYDRLSEAYAERSTLILALGGGVIGDLAGFVAATYMRGTPYVQVPTSLLAMVDSSIGGKTAVDRGKLKNIVGAFYQPRMVIGDIATLKTLPPVELSNGMAEIIKMAGVYSEPLFDYLENNMSKAMGMDLAVLERVTVENDRLKAPVVERDEKETGTERIMLNYGHTVGHAVEAVSDFALKHGQAVAIGMVAENEIARRMGYLDSAAAKRMEKVIKAAGLPARPPALNIKKVMRAMQQDKKVLRGRVRFVLLKSIGEAFIADNVEPALVEEVLSRG